MAAHAGFAAVVGLSASTLDGLAGALYHAGRTTRFLDATLPPFGTPRVRFSNVFLGPPQFALATNLQQPGAQPGRPRIGLRLHGRGSVTSSPSGQPAQTRHSDVDFLITMEAQARLINRRIGIVTDASTMKLETFTVAPFPGSSFDAQYQADLTSAGVRQLIELGFTLILGTMGPLVPPFDVSFLGAVAAQSSSKASLGVVDGELLIGIDVNEPPVVTTGDVTQFTAVTPPDDVAMITNPAAISLSTGTLTSQLTSAATQQGATVQSLTITLQQGHIAVAGAVGNDVGNVSFSMKAVPYLEGLFDKTERHIRVRLDDVVVNVNPAWWVWLLDGFTLGLGTTIIDFFSSFIRSNVVNGILTQPPSDSGAARRTFTLPGVTAPTITVDVDRVECHTDGFEVGMQLEVEHLAAKVSGPQSVDADEVPTFDASPVRLALDFGTAARREDPYLRLRWAVYSAAGAELFVRDRPTSSPGGSELLLRQSTLPWLTIPTYRITCYLYRTHGEISEALMYETRWLRVVDRLDRSHPYVRWIHQAEVPMVTKKPDGSQTILGTKIVTRRSKLHRTAIPGRCISASHYSQTWLNPDSKVKGPVLEYLDALPFPRADLVARRGQVCDYCFFGGPTRTVPRIP